MPFIAPLPAGQPSPFEQNRQFLLGTSQTPAPPPGGGGLAGGTGLAGAQPAQAAPVPTAPQTTVAGPRIAPSATALGAPQQPLAGGAFSGRETGPTTQLAGFPSIPKTSGGIQSAPRETVSSSGPGVLQTPQAPPGPTQPRIQQPTAGAPFDLSQGVLKGIVSPIYQGVQAGGQALQDINATFQEGAGNSRNFQSVGGPGILDRAITPWQDNPEAEANAFKGAQALLASDYTGPTGFDPTKVAALDTDLTGIGQRVAGLGTGAGLTSTLQAGIPGLNQGMAEFDAQLLSQDPNLLSERLASRDAWEALQGQADRDRKQAEAYAKQRDAEEQAIADASRGYITDKREGALEGLDARVTAAQAAQDKTRDAFSAFQETGDLGNLYTGFTATNPLPETAFAGGYESLNPFFGPRQQTQAALDSYWAVANRYPDIKNMPPLDVIPGKRGNEKYSLSGDESNEELWDSVKKGIITRETFEQIMARQREWEQAGFSPGTTESFAGKNAAIAPLYFGENEGSVLENLYQPPDFRDPNYWSIDRGTEAARENLATKDERYMVDRIGALLNEAYRLEDAKEPFRAAQIAANAEAFLQDVQAEIQARQERGEAMSKSFVASVNKAAKRYEKKKRGASFGSVMRVVGAVGTGGLTEVSRGTPGLGDLQEKGEAQAGAAVGNSRGGYLLEGSVTGR